MGLPMMPRTIKPTFIVMSLSLLLRWRLFLKGISQFLRGGAEYAQIAADGDKGLRPFQIATRIRFYRRQNTARLAMLFALAKNVLDSLLDLQGERRCQMSQRGGQIAWADKKYRQRPQSRRSHQRYPPLLAFNLYGMVMFWFDCAKVIRHRAKHIGAVRHGKRRGVPFWRVAGGGDGVNRFFFAFHERDQKL